MSDTEVRTTTRMRWMTAVRRQQMVHHLTGTGNMQYMLNMMNWKTEKEQLLVNLRIFLIKNEQAGGVN